MDENELQAERAANQKHLINVLKASPVWTDVIHPALSIWMKRLENRMATDKSIDAEMLRFIQGEHQTLRRLRDDPDHLLAFLKAEKR